MRVYVAGGFNSSAPREFADQARANGYEVVSSWLGGGGATAGDEWTATARKWADTCLADLARADVLVAVQPEESTTGGTHFETAWAAQAGIAVVILGRRSCVFHHLYPAFPFVSDALIYLRGLNDPTPLRYAAIDRDPTFSQAGATP